MSGKNRCLRANRYRSCHLEKGRPLYLDTDGKRLIDLHINGGVFNLGHRQLLFDGIGVQADLRGRGIGTALLEAVDRRARELDKTEVIQEVVDTPGPGRSMNGSGIGPCLPHGGGCFVWQDSPPPI